ncbi:MAG TPA: glycosyltransferase, partial [Methylomirabilota bacterium]|nr:glycosyltransferase [Methylomirabilota bacterium]
ACGVFQIADRRAELDETLGAAVPTFESPRELEELVRHYLAQPTQRRRLADRARRSIQPHTFGARALQVLADLDRSGRESRNGRQVRR